MSKNFLEGLETDDQPSILSISNPQENTIEPSRSELLAHDADEDIQNLIPVRNCVTLSEHSGAITTIKLDSHQQRMVSGGNDYQLCFWDLCNLSNPAKPFRVLEPHEKQPIVQVAFSNDDQKLLVCSGGAKPKVLTRDGKEIIEFIKGDMYIKDLNHTKGHTSGVTDCCFHSKKPDTCVTSSLDGTVRLWDLNTRPFGIERLLPCTQIIKCKRENGQRAGVSRFAINSDELIIAFCDDNSIQCFSERSHFSRPELLFRSEAIGQVSNVCLFKDQVRFATREMDDSVKVFDLRKLTEPLQVFNNLYNANSNTGLCLSPDERFVLTGTSKSKEKPGQLMIIDLESEKTISLYESMNGSVTAINWNHQIDQIFVGFGNDIRVFYDEKLSSKGILDSFKRMPKKIAVEDIKYDQPIYVPNALRMFRPDENFKRKRFDKIRNDPVLTKKPTEMLTGPGYNGQISGPRTTAQFVMRTIHEISKERVDPLESLKKYATQAQERPQFVETAYLLTQPKKILDYSSKDAAEQQLMAMFKKCPHCGLRICMCKPKKNR